MLPSPRYPGLPGRHGATERPESTRKKPPISGPRIRQGRHAGGCGLQNHRTRTGPVPVRMGSAGGSAQAGPGWPTGRADGLSGDTTNCPPHCLTLIATGGGRCLRCFPTGLKRRAKVSGGRAGQGSMAARTELLEAVGVRCHGSNRVERSRILDEFVAVAGYHRKHAIRLLGAGKDGWEAKPTAGRLARPGRYGPGVREALVTSWEASDRVCSKRLRPLIPVLLPAPGRHGVLDLRRCTTTGMMQQVSAGPEARPLLARLGHGGTRCGGIRRLERATAAH